MQYGEEHSKTEEKTPHLQGFICFDSQRTKRSVLKLFPHGTHMEAMKGRIDQNERYVAKEHLAFSKGTAPKTQAQKGQMEKDRYASAYELAKEGKLEDIDKDLLTRHYTTYQKIKRDHYVEPAAISTLEHYWYCGPSGSGKSSGARADYPNAYKKLPNKWWDGYQGQEAVIIDDLDPSHADSQRYHLKLWCDHGAFPAETKGGQLIIRPRHIIVTSQYTINEIFPDERTREALNRRFTEVKFPRNLVDPGSNADSSISSVVPAIDKKRAAFYHWATMNNK